MKKRQAILLLIVMTLAACSMDRNTSSSHSDMSSREAQTAGYVTTGPGGTANIDKLEAFYNDFTKKKKSQVTIANYTDEGDPVYTDLSYDGQTINYVYDNSWDGFGGEDKGVKQTTCNMISKRTGSMAARGTEYFLSDCSADIGFSYPDKGEYHLFFLEEKPNEKS